MKCRICNNEVGKIFSANVLNKYNIGYYHCDECGFLQTEEPFWLDESYNSPINLTDTGLLQRNIYLSKKVAIILYFIFGAKGKYLDYAGGYGIFTRLMRDIGFDFFWTDPYTQNLIAKGFEYNSIDTIDAITTFETFEHFVNPIEEIKKIIEISPNIIFTTELLPSNIPEPQKWWYYGFEHGQHISFYSEKTLAYIAKMYELNFITNGRIHLFTNKKINKNYYSMLLKLSKFGLFRIICKKMDSRTLLDMNLMKHNSSNH